MYLVFVLVIVWGGIFYVINLFFCCICNDIDYSSMYYFVGVNEVWWFEMIKDISV